MKPILQILFFVFAASLPIRGDDKPNILFFFCEHLNLRYGMSWEGVRGERFKYARYVDQDPVQEFLHDLKNDPNELVNLAGNPEYAALLKQLRQRTDALLESYAEAAY